MQKTISFKIKKALKSLFPKKVYLYLLITYRFIFSYVPGTSYYFIKKNKDKFTERQLINIKGTDKKIMIDPKNGPLDLGLFIYGHRDDAIVELMKKYLKEGDIAVDLGANIGYETINASMFVGESGVVHSFEPNPDLVTQIKESLEANKMNNVVVHQKAVGDKEEIIKFYVEPKGPANASAVVGPDSTLLMEANVVTLDKELENIEIRFIKIDIEGYEFEALKGALNLIKKYHPVIVFEFSPMTYEGHYVGKSLEMLMFMVDNSYEIATVEEPDKIIKKEEFDNLIKRIIDDETIVNLVAKNSNGLQDA